MSPFSTMFNFLSMGLVIGLAALAYLFLTSNRSPVLVLQRFKVDEASPEGLFIQLEGRAAGLTGWILSHMGLQPKTVMRVTSTEWHKEETSLSGQHHWVVPLTAIATTYGGFDKPFRTFIFGVGILGLTLIYQFPMLFSQNSASVQGAIILVLIAAIICGVCCLIYWFRRRLTIRIRAGGQTLRVIFQPSVIENERIDLDRTLEVIGLLHRKIIESRTRLADARA